MLQEATPDICDIFERSAAWWEKYNRTSIHQNDIFFYRIDQDQLLLLGKFPLAKLERRTFFTMDARQQGYLIADMKPSPSATTMPPICIATAQLVRSDPPASMRFRDRYMHAEHILADLSGHRNAVFGGDMSWCDDSDLPFPLPAGWVDAWTALRGQDCYQGWTYDSVWEVEATRFNSYVANYHGMRKRSDRFVCKLKDYKLSRIELIGDQTMGPTYHTKPEVNDSHGIKLRPSCHCGLVLTIVPNEQSAGKCRFRIKALLTQPLTRWRTRSKPFVYPVHMRKPVPANNRFWQQ
jgi:hypothetical protein